MSPSNADLAADELDVHTEEFHWMGLVRIDVRSAKQILASKKRKPQIYRCDLQPLVKMVRRSKTEMLPDGTLNVFTSPVALDWGQIDGEEIDLDVPILLARLPAKLGNGVWPIDGWHRIARAVEARMESLPCHILSRNDTCKVIQWPSE
jgi:hypothetical protein